MSLNILKIGIGLVLVGVTATSYADVITIGDERIKNVKSMSLGQYRACLIADEGMRCWGDAFDPEIPADFDYTDVAKVSVGANHACLLTKSSSVKCIGENFYGESIVPDGLTNVTDVQAQGYYTCAIADSKVKCWGANFNGQLNVPEAVKLAKQIALGPNHACALDAVAGVVCWGRNTYGQLNVPVGLVNPRQISLANEHTCVLDDNGVKCWGLGVEYLNVIPNELLVQKVSKFSTGDSHVCALTEDKRVTCWGDSVDGTLTAITKVPEDVYDVDDIESKSGYSCSTSKASGLRCWGINYFGTTHTPMNYTTASTFDAGGYHVCGLLGAKIDCFGSNKRNQVTSLEVEDEFTQLSAGFSHTCGVTVLGKVVCWGDSTDLKTYPPTGLSKAVSVDSGDQNSCAITENGVVCWGNNKFEQNVVPSTAYDATQVSVGRSHICALTSLGVQCWGSNIFEQLMTPSGLGEVESISSGGNFTCALSKTGLVKCWGDNSSDQLSVPADLGRATKLSSGGAHACVVTEDGKVRCWGRNVYGQCDVPELNNPKHLSSGYAHTCAQTDDGIVCWGLIGRE